MYKECNIGTSKPSAEVMGAVPHHLISSRSCAHPINVKEFCDEAIEIAKVGSTLAWQFMLSVLHVLASLICARGVCVYNMCV